MLFKQAAENMALIGQNFAVGVTESGEMEFCKHIPEGVSGRNHPLVRAWNGACWGIIKRYSMLRMIPPVQSQINPFLPSLGSPRAPQ